MLPSASTAGIAHRMQVVGDLHAQRDRERRAFNAAHPHAHRAARRTVGYPRDQRDRPPPAPRWLPRAELHLRPRVIAHAEPAALDGISPPGSAAAGFTLSILGRASSFQCFSE